MNVLSIYELSLALCCGQIRDAYFDIIVLYLRCMLMARDLTRGDLLGCLTGTHILESGIVWLYPLDICLLDDKYSSGMGPLWIQDRACLQMLYNALLVEPDKAVCSDTTRRVMPFLKQ